jgi:peptide/nickel transport system substrate-binding protein
MPHSLGSRSILVVILVALATGCHGGGDTATTPSNAATTSPVSTGPTTTTMTTLAATPAGGGVVIGSVQELPTLNPLAPGGSNEIVEAVASLYVPGAFDVAPDLELVPDLVEDIPSLDNGDVVVDPDGAMSVTWRIRPEAVWSDGMPISGDDFAFSLDLGRDQPVPDVLSVEPGEKSITVRFAEPSLVYEGLFRWVVPRHAVDGTDLDLDWNTKMWPSGGPFVFDEWVPGERLRLVRNDRYWKTEETTGAAGPFLDSVEIRFVPSETDLAAAIAAGNVDVASFRSPEGITAFRNVGDMSLNVDTSPGTVLESLMISFGDDNPTGESLNTSLSYRRAIAAALDRDSLAAAWYGDDSVRPSDSLVTVTPGDGPWSAYSYDPAGASRLLTAACDAARRDCVSDPPHVRLRVPWNAGPEARLADDVVTMLQNAGFSAEVEVFTTQDIVPWDVPWDLGIWLVETQPGAEGVVASFGLFDADAASPYRYEYRWSAGSEPAASEFETILEAMHATTDPTAIRNLAAAAQGLLAAQVVTIPLVRRSVVTAFTNAIGGFVPHPDPSNAFWSIPGWYRTDL